MPNFLLYTNWECYTIFKTHLYHGHSHKNIFSHFLFNTTNQKGMMIMQYNPFFVRYPPSHHHAIHSFSFVIWVSKEKKLEGISIPSQIQKKPTTLSSFSWTAIERIVTDFYFYFLWGVYPGNPMRGWKSRGIKKRFEWDLEWEQCLFNGTRGMLSLSIWFCQHSCPLPCFLVLLYYFLIFPVLVSPKPTKKSYPSSFLRFEMHKELKVKSEEISQETDIF